MRLPSNLRPLMHPGQPSLARGDSDLLAEEHEDQQGQIVGGEHAAEDARNDIDVSVRQDPGQQVEAHGERNCLLAQVHRDQHFRQVDRVTVHGVGQRKGEVEVRGEVDHGDSSKVAKPMQILSSSEAVHNQAGRSDNHGGQKNTKSHLGLTDATILLGQVRRQAVGRRRERNGEDVADGITHGDQARIGLPELSA